MINKAVAGQSEFKSAHAYNNGTVRCVGTQSDERAEYAEWTKAEQAIVHKFIALVAAKVGGYESEDQAKIIAEMDSKITELKAIEPVAIEK